MKNLAFESPSFKKEKWQEACKRLHGKVVRLFSLEENKLNWSDTIGEIAKKTGIAGEEIRKFAAYHILIQSTPDFQKNPEFDTSQKDIEKAIDDMIKEKEEGSLMEKKFSVGS